MNSGSNNNNEKGVEVRTHDIPVADAMSEFMKQGWAESPLTDITPHPSIAYTKVRREKLSKQYVGKRLIPCALPAAIIFSHSSNPCSVGT